MKPKIILPKVRLSTITGTGQDEILLDFFSRVTAPKIAGFYDDLNFWKGTVVQLAHSDPGVRLAIQAVSSLHAEVEKVEGNRLKDIDPSVLQTYNDAIRRLVSNSTEPLYIKAVVVALFVCIEMLVGNEESASVHIIGGLKLLQDWKSRSASSSPSTDVSDPNSPESSTATRSDTSSEKEIVEELTATFSRLAVHSRVFGKRMFQVLWPAQDESNETEFHFDTMAESRNVGFVILGDAISFVSRATPLSYLQEGAGEAMFTEQRVTRARIVGWRRGYQDYAHKYMMTMSPKQIRAGNMIQCLMLCSYVWVCTCLSPYEEDYDRYTAEFQEVIDLAKTVIDIPEEYLCAKVGRFQLDMGLVPGLHLVGGRCRVPAIRKAAMDMLSQYHWREGLFDSFRSAEFIAVCHQLEETRKQELMGLKDSELEDYLPCEGARIHFVGVDEVRDGPETQFLVHSFYTKPYGAYGDWHVQQCMLPANPTKLDVSRVDASDIRAIPGSAYEMPSIHSGNAYQNSGAFNPEVRAATMERKRTFRVPNDVTETLSEQSNGMLYRQLMGQNHAKRSSSLNGIKQTHDAVI